MLLEISTELECSAERAWQEVQTTRLLEYVAHPLLVFDPIEPQTWPETWREGEYLSRMRLLGIIPFGKQCIAISIPDRSNASAKGEYRVRDNGYGDMVKKWDHLIVIEEVADGTTRYTDRLEIEAGILTPIVWLYARVFYQHRQARWRKLARSDFDYGQ